MGNSKMSQLNDIAGLNEPEITSNRICQWVNCFSGDQTVLNSDPLNGYSAIIEDRVLR
jgi:hypothetical protein